MLENLLDLSSKVTITLHKETGELLKIGRNPDYCSVRVESSTITNDDGFMDLKTRVAKVRMPVKLAEILVAKGLLKEGKEFPMQGKIIVRESFEPFYEGQEPKINPSTAELVLFLGEPIYRQSIFTSNMNDRDMFIREYYLSLQQNNGVMEHTDVAEPMGFDKFMEKEFAVA
jgi:hypothetical protein